MSARRWVPVAAKRSEADKFWGEWLDQDQSDQSLDSDCNDQREQSEPVLGKLSAVHEQESIAIFEQTILNTLI